METSPKDEVFDIKLALKTALKTLLSCFIGIMFVLSFIFVVSPRFSLKINNTLGFKKVKELNYQMIYSRNKNIADLYNVILYEAEIGNCTKELSYIDEILERDDYSIFCKTLDEASLNTVKNKNMLPYSVNVNGYLTSRKVICMYNLDLNGIETYVYRQTKEGKLTEYGYSAYVDTVYSDSNLTIESKREKLGLLMSIMDTSGKKLSEILDDKAFNIKEALVIETDKQGQIALQYSLVRIYRSKYFVADVLQDQAKKTENDELFKQAKLKLNEMIGL